MAAAGEPHEHGLADGHRAPARPAGALPAGTEPARGMVRAVHQLRELRQRDRVLLTDDPQQLDVAGPAGDDAGIGPGGWRCVGGRRVLTTHEGSARAWFS